MTNKTHSTRPGWGETHTHCGLDLNPSCGSHRAQPTLSDAPTCRSCATAERPAPRTPEPTCEKCGMGKMGHDMFMPHPFEAVSC